ncbi:microtubule-associated protein (MAP) [Scheffersomyces stipitis CBS 6054]|uniref:Microtubule-associated protein (MAP) n=1 Tax=Scheffersomyces stipitis (strain ATCC 58785 / CBS 6054 / NBRC 10063 / NRRL Y-11545) TaxID=322104 RepID=A3LPI3_PICST|nr:microtubule-associated protein (MAP) [Scheffersomyces stipitis CBS 6054]ABN64497.2 microtubule-associated protein (MAP) [Scheffersomyces stipitis CBS 6054]
MASEYDTGVSNGDVDWLFRGKSKKLTKKMNIVPVNGAERRNNSREDDAAEKEKELSAKTSPTDKKDATSANSNMNTNSTANTNTTPTTNAAINSTVSSKPSAPSVTANSNMPANQNPGKDAVAEKLSKLDKFKFGRSRSSSASSVTNQPPETQAQQNQKVLAQNATKRRGSLNFISPSLTSDLAYNDNDIAAAHTSSSPNSSPNVSRSNSSSGKSRSLFSSLSSKFKSSSAIPSSTATATPPSTSTSTLTSQPQQKLNPNLIGSASGSTDPNSQDLASVVNKPPAGIPGKRRTSFGTKLGSSPTQKEIFVPATETVNSTRRRSSLVPSDFPIKSSSTTSSSSISSCAATNRIVLNKNPNRGKIPLKDLNGINLRRVTFAIDKLAYDPQQQIPSRRPKKGNVLIPQDLMAPPPRLSQGISLNDGNRVESQQTHQYTDKEIALAIDAQRRALLEAEKHAQEAHLSAKRIAVEVGLFKQQKSRSSSSVGFSSFTSGTSVGSTTDEDDDIGDMAHDVGKIEIDKPLHFHENHFDESTEEPTGELSLEVIYTRCCHLREILPIPATLRQLKNKSKPLQVLKLLNPKPTLIDVLSFSDFIAITPINTVIFDNVTMTTEMLKHFLASLVYNKSLEKLSLRNVAIDEIGWKYLCKFLSRNTSIKKLDISQQRVKTETKANCIRANMNWDLFIQSLVLRGGIEELVINGCKLTDEKFKDLVENTVSISTYRFGIASIELNLFKAQVVADWLSSEGSKCVGVDIAFNDLSKGQLKPFIKAFDKGNANLLFFSLNSTHLTDVDETTELIKSLVKVKTLRFLDLSSIPDVFPAIISRLGKYLPHYENLRRIHFDLNELSAQSIGVISEFLPRIKTLVHVSMLGNRSLNISAAGTLYNAVKLSSSIFTLDLDYDLIPDDLSQRIAFYLMRNMDRTMRPELDSTTNHKDNEEDLMFDGSLLMQTAEKLLMENESQDDVKKQKEDLKIQRIVTNALIERTRSIRKDIHAAIDTLFEKRNQGTLSLEGKETLLRFCLLDSSLEKLVHMFEEQAAKSVLKDTNPIDNITNGPGIDRVNSPLNITITTHDNMHESSTELITSGPIVTPHITKPEAQYFPGLDPAFLPHQVVSEATSDGVDVPIDYLTGRPVLMRSISQTSVHAKEQEKEEGEFHRLGFFMQSRDNSSDESGKSEPTSESKAPSSPSANKHLPLLNVLPSGPELRDAIIAAKGIESVTDLIDKINNNDRASIDKIYKACGKDDDGKACNKCEPKDVADDISIDSDIDAIDTVTCSHKDHEVNAVVDEVYEKLLNDAQRSRSNKQD